MNLYEFSQVNNNEMGILIQKSIDFECYSDAEKETTRIFRISKEHKSRINNSIESSTLESGEKPAIPKQSVVSEDNYDKLIAEKKQMNDKCLSQKSKADETLDKLINWFKT